MFQNEEPVARGELMAPAGADYPLDPVPGRRVPQITPRSEPNSKLRCIRTVRKVEITGANAASVFQKVLNPCPFHYAVSFLRPLRRLRLTTSRPLRVRIRRRNPSFLFLFSLCGLYVSDIVLPLSILLA